MGPQRRGTLIQGTPFRDFCWLDWERITKLNLIFDRPRVPQKVSFLLYQTRPSNFIFCSKNWVESLSKFIVIVLMYERLIMSFVWDFSGTNKVNRAWDRRERGLECGNLTDHSWGLGTRKESAYLCQNIRSFPSRGRALLWWIHHSQQRPNIALFAGWFMVILSREQLGSF